MSDAAPPNRVSPHLPTDDPEAVASPMHATARKAWDEALSEPLELDGRTFGAPESWFLGPKAENLDLMMAMIQETLTSHAEFRRAFHPEDPSPHYGRDPAVPRVPGRCCAHARRAPDAARQAPDVGLVHVHAVSGPHALGPGYAGRHRPVRRHAIQSKQRRRRGLPRHDQTGNRGRQTIFAVCSAMRCQSRVQSQARGCRCRGAT